MDRNGRRGEARDALIGREVQQILPGIDPDAVYVRSALPSSMARKTGIIRYDDLPEVLTPKEVQAFLRLGRNAVYGALQDGTIRSVRHGQKFLIPKTALREFLDRDGEHPSAGIPVKGTT